MRHLYPLTIAFMVLTSCGSPLQVVRVAPAEEANVDHHRYGSAVQRSERSGYSVEISFYDASPEYLVFDVEVGNESAQTIEIDPTEARLTTDAGKEIWAVDPELELLTLDLESVQQARNARTLAWASAAVVVAASVYSLSTAEGLDFGGAADNALLVSNIGNSAADLMTFVVLQDEENILRRNLIPEAGAVPSPDNRFFWLDHSFRRTTLRPGEAAIGKLVFERVDDARAFQISFPVGDHTEFSFPFTQRIYRNLQSVR